MGALTLDQLTDEQRAKVIAAREEKFQEFWVKTGGSEQEARDKWNSIKLHCGHTVLRKLDKWGAPVTWEDPCPVCGIQ